MYVQILFFLSKAASGAKLLLITKECGKGSKSLWTIYTNR